MPIVPKWDWFHFGKLRWEGVLLGFLEVRRSAVPYWEMREFAWNGADLLFVVSVQALSKGVPVWHAK